jgi:hypothetical protein
MAAQLTQHFRAALTRIGLDVPARNAIVEQGIVNMDATQRFTDESISSLCKIARQEDDVEITFTHEMRFHALRAWVKDRKRCGLATDAALFTLQIANSMQERLAFNKELLSVKDTVKIPMPEAFSKSSMFPGWKDAMATYFAQLKSSDNDISLSYIIRELAVAPDDVEYEDPREEKSAKVLLAGPNYMIDNKRVFAIIKTLTLAGPGWSWIVKFDKKSDGRKAWLALVAHYEGTSSQNHMKELARKAIRDTEYVGDRRNFTFDQYIQVFQKAYATLERLDDPTKPETQVTQFMDNIKDSSVKMEAAMAFVTGNPIYALDFDAATQYMSGFVMTLTNRSTKVTRSVGALTGQPSPYQGGGGQGRGDTRARRRGRGGRGGQGNRPNNKSTFLPKEEWDALSPEEKSQILSKRWKPHQNAGRKRGVASISSVHGENGGAADSGITNPSVSHAGNGFHRDGNSRRGS